MNAPAETFAIAQRRPVSLRRHLHALYSCKVQGELALARIQHREVMRLLGVDDADAANDVRGILDQAIAHLKLCMTTRRHAIVDAWARTASRSSSPAVHRGG